jgi:hypothetical protein
MCWRTDRVYFLPFSLGPDGLRAPDPSLTGRSAAERLGPASLSGERNIAESGIGRGLDRGVGVEAPIGSCGAGAAGDRVPALVESRGVSP